MAQPSIQSFEDFWPYYVRAHSKKATRRLHFAGTTGAMACLAGAVLLKKRWLLAAAPVVGYAPAWIGHFFVEGNVPATFGHPIWSLRADLKMWSMMLAGTMDAEVERVMTAPAETAPNGHAAEPTPPQPDANGAGGRETLN